LPPRVICVAALVLGACVTTRADSVGGGDSRLDDTTRPEKGSADSDPRDTRSCGPEGKGDLVLLDARTAGPLTCTMVTVSRESSSCRLGNDCVSETVFQGRTNAHGQIAVAERLTKVRLVAVADGYSPSYLDEASSNGARILELEMAPLEGFWIKVIDADGNYLQDVLISFKQGAEIIANVRTNDLANVFFAERNPFSGEPVTVEAQGYRAVTVANVAELGADGHTLTLQK
jgi:hypothetical protein